MSSRILPALMGATAITSAALCAAPAFAQSATSLGEVVVTARRTEERLQDVPISITVFSQEQIAKQNIVNTSDLALYTPSLGSSNPLGSSSAVFSLRGFNTDQGTAPTVGVFFADVVSPRGAQSQSSVGDGAGVGSFFDLQNVQILKGPQGTLFGRNTTGGTILLVPQKPSDQFEGYVEGSVGNYDLRRVQAVVNFPITDAARFRFGVDRQKRQGFVKNNLDIGKKHFSDVDYLALRGSMVLDITPNLENYTIATYSNDDNNGEFNTMFASRPSASINPLANIAATPFAYLAAKQFERYSPGGERDFYSTEGIIGDPFTKQKVWQLINTTTWRASDDLTVKNIISYGELTYDSRSMVFGTAFDLADFNPFGQAMMDLLVNSRLPAGAPRAVFRPYPVGTFMALSGINPSPGGHFSHQRTFTEELQFQGKAIDGKLAWQAGAYYENSTPIGSEIKASLSPGLAICPNYDFVCANPFFGFGSLGQPAGTKASRSIGLYTQATYEITDKLSFTGGFRYTWDRINARGNGRTFAIAWNPFDTNPVSLVQAGPVRCTNPNDSLANNCLVTVTAKSSAPTWLLDLDYKPNDDMLLYVKWARGYRSGGTALQMPSEFRTYGPEKVDTYETGLKATFDGPVRGTFNVAAFYNDFRNQQVPLSIVPKVPGTVPNAVGVNNAGKSRIYGLEVESSVEVLPDFVVSTGYAYLNTKVKKLTQPVISPTSPYTIIPGVGIREGDPLQYTPKHKVSVNFAYTLPLDENIGRITLGTTYTYTSKQVTIFNYRDAAGKLTGYSFLKERALVDANITWKDFMGAPVDVTIFGNNIFQKHYFNYILDAQLGFQTAQLGTPRMFGVRVKYAFGK
jgi:iron complex outermembrane receptor protein